MSLLCRLGIGAYVYRPLYQADTLQSPPRQLERISAGWEIIPGQMGVKLCDCEEKVDVANVTCHTCA